MEEKVNESKISIRALRIFLNLIENVRMRDFNSIFSQDFLMKLPLLPPKYNYNISECPPRWRCWCYGWYLENMINPRPGSISPSPSQAGIILIKPLWHWLTRHRQQQKKNFSLLLFLFGKPGQTSSRSSIKQGDISVIVHYYTWWGSNILHHSGQEFLCKNENQDPCYLCFCCVSVKGGCHKNPHGWSRNKSVNLAKSIIILHPISLYLFVEIPRFGFFSATFPISISAHTTSPGQTNGSLSLARRGENSLLLRANIRHWY